MAWLLKPDNFLFDARLPHYADVHFKYMHNVLQDLECL